MPDHAGFAGAITVREHVLRTALQPGYANGPDPSKKFTRDLSDSALGMEPDLFFGLPDFNCEGSTKLLVVTLPMWGTVKVTQSGVESLVQMAGEMELILTPDFRIPAVSTMLNGPLPTSLGSLPLIWSILMDMNSMDASEAREKFYTLIDEAANHHEPLLITGPGANAVLVGEEHWNAIQETLHLLSVPGMRDSIIEGLATPLDQCDRQPGW
jgi:antitoxin YefM